MSWTDEKTEKTTVTSSYSKISQIKWPERAKAGEKCNYSIICTMYGGGAGMIAVHNEKGNPGDMVFTITSLPGHVYTVPPGHTLIFTAYDICNGCGYFMDGTVTFTKPGKYDITILAGVKT